MEEPNISEVEDWLESELATAKRLQDKKGRSIADSEDLGRVLRDAKYHASYLGRSIPEICQGDEAHLRIEAQKYRDMDTAEYYSD